MVSDAMWAKYVGIINSFHDDANQQVITWESARSIKSRLGTDVIREEKQILGLIQYNFFRNWPINKASATGEVDKESMVVLFNIEYMKTEGYLNLNEQFDFDPGYDRFVVDGIRYKAMGDSKTAQAKNKAIMLFVILQREEVETGQELK